MQGARGEGAGRFALARLLQGRGGQQGTGKPGSPALRAEPSPEDGWRWPWLGPCVGQSAEAERAVGRLLQAPAYSHQLQGVPGSG